MGILFLGYSAHSTVNIPLFSSDGFMSWLIQDAQVVEFIEYSFLLQGIWQLGLALFILITAATGYRQNQRWAWYAMWVVPALLAGVTLAISWILPLTALMILAKIIAQLAARSTFFDAQLQPI